MTRKISLYLQVLLYVAAGINHFIHPLFYISIMPDYLPYPSALVLISGIAEVVLGILLVPIQTRKTAAWLIALMLVVYLLVHIDMLQLSFHQDPYLIRPVTAVIRLLVQPLLIAWILWTARLIPFLKRSLNK